MAAYKYLVEEGHPFSDENDCVHLPEGHTQTDEGAINYALSDSMAVLDEMGRPIVYKAHKSTSNWGCGFDSCTACGGWHTFADGETIHGELIKQGAK